MLRESHSDHAGAEKKSIEDGNLPKSKIDLVKLRLLILRSTISWPSIPHILNTGNIRDRIHDQRKSVATVTSDEEEMGRDSQGKKRMRHSQRKSNVSEDESESCSLDNRHTRCFLITLNEVPKHFFKVSKHYKHDFKVFKHDLNVFKHD